VYYPDIFHRPKCKQWWGSLSCRHSQVSAQSDRQGLQLTLDSYIDALKRKRDELKNCLRHKRQRLDVPPERQSHSRQRSQGEALGTENNTSDQTVQAAMGEIGFLSRSAMAEPRDENSGLSQGLTIGRMVRVTLALSGANPAQSSRDLYVQGLSVMVDLSATLKRQLALPLVTRFLEITGAQFMHIKPKELWDDFELVFENIDNQSFHPQPAKVFNVYIAVAVGALLSPESGSLQGLASNLHATAMKLFSGILSSGTRIDILHCMFLLAIYSMYSSLGGSTWHLVGLAVKKAIAFGFHKDPDVGVEITPEALRSRRNIFWGLYTLDRYTSLRISSACPC
jgi:hypothetical protein